MLHTDPAGEPLWPDAVFARTGAALLSVATDKPSDAKKLANEIDEKFPGAVARVAVHCSKCCAH
jgi:hypothetical protein